MNAGHLKVKLCTALCDLYFYPTSRGLVPLHNACSYGHREVTEALLSYGGNVNALDLWQFTPLHEAASKARYNILLTYY